MKCPHKTSRKLDMSSRKNWEFSFSKDFSYKVLDENVFTKYQGSKLDMLSLEGADGDHRVSGSHAFNHQGQTFPLVCHKILMIVILENYSNSWYVESMLCTIKGKVVEIFAPVYHNISIITDQN